MSVPRVRETKPWERSGNQRRKHSLPADEWMDNDFPIEETEYPSDMYEPRDSHLGSATTEAVAIIGVIVAGVAAIIYMTNRKA